jgi:hypothetical protein
MPHYHDTEEDVLALTAALGVAYLLRPRAPRSDKQPHVCRHPFFHWLAAWTAGFAGLVLAVDGGGQIVKWITDHLAHGNPSWYWSIAVWVLLWYLAPIVGYALVITGCHPYRR